MAVDGGKSLTSRGQQDWYGSQYMNRKFENDAKRSQLNFMMQQKKTTKPPQSGSVRALENWIDETQKSGWATRSDDAHSKYMSMYANQVEEVRHMEHANNSHVAGNMNNPAVARPINPNPSSPATGQS